MRSTKSARGKGVSLVEELEQQTADAALAELAMQQGSGSPGGGKSASVQHPGIIAAGITADCRLG
jgi:hypothetical protein